MWKDPIVEEIHAAREQIARACNYDLQTILTRLKQQEAEHPERLVRKDDIPKAKPAGR